MEEFEFNIVLRQKLRKNIKELETAQPDIFITKFNELHAILLQYSDQVNALNYESIKYKALQFSKVQFLELLTILDPENAINILDKRFLYHLIEEIYIFINSNSNDIKEGGKDSKIITFEENTNECAKSNVMTVSFQTNDEQTENDKNCNNSVYQDEVSNSSVYDDNQFYVNFIDDEGIICIFNIFNIALKHFTITFAEKLHNHGFFNLLNVLVTDKSCMLLQTMYENKIYLIETDELQCNDVHKMPIMEIQRKYFDTQVVVKEKQETNNFELREKYKRTRHTIYTETAEYFFASNAFYFLLEFGLENLSNLILTYLSCKETNNEVISNLFANDDIISEIKQLVLESDDEKYPRIYQLLQSKLIMSKHVIIKYNLDSSFNNKLFKRLQEGKINYRMEIIMILFFILKYIKTLNKELTEEISLKDEFYGLQNQKSIGNIFELLNYSFNNIDKVLYVLAKLYATFDKKMFYKPSYFIVMKNVRYTRESKHFVESYLRDIVLFYTESPFNSVKSFFPPPKIKLLKVDENHNDEVKLEDSNDENIELLFK